MSKGWISLEREFQDHYLWQEDRIFNRSEAWLDLLFSAYFKDVKTIFNGKTITVKRGSFITSELKLMARWKWSKTKTRTFLKLLIDDNMIIKDSDNKKTTLTIVNYKEYQDKANNRKTSKKQQKDFKKTSEDTHYNNVNKENKENKESKAEDLLKFLNERVNKKYRSIPEANLNARLKDGYTFEEIKKAIVNASNDPFQIETDYKHLTLEYILRKNQLDKWINVSSKAEEIKTKKEADLKELLRVGKINQEENYG